MMNFADWLYFEALDFATEAPAELEPILGGWRAKFADNDGRMYSVVFSRWPIMVDNQVVVPRDQSYEVLFRGPNSMDLTHYGTPFHIYRKVFGVINTFLKDIQPLGLSFSGLEPKMDLLYHKFYEKYLKSTYTRIDKEQYVRNDEAEKLGLKPIDSNQLNNYLAQVRKRQIQTRMAAKDHFAASQNP